MSLQDLLDLRYEDESGTGAFSDPVTITQIGRVLDNANSRAVAASLVVCTSPCLVFGFTVSSVSAQFIQLFDMPTVPADTTVPLLSFPVQATNTIANAWVPYPRFFRNGCVICNSSTQHAKTIGSADCVFDVQFI